MRWHALISVSHFMTQCANSLPVYRHRVAKPFSTGMKSSPLWQDLLQRWGCYASTDADASVLAAIWLHSRRGQTRCL